MDERKAIRHELNELEVQLKDLQIRYEQYFTGVEKREPLRDRDEFARRLRRFTNRRITYTDLRFKHQTLATRYHSYAGYWDRILRQIDEGKFIRQRPRPGQVAGSQSQAEPENETDTVYRELLRARQACKVAGPEPSAQQIANFLDKQKTRIREKFGDRDVEFLVVTEEGKPKIKVRAKK